MLTLNDGRSELWQWDTGRTLSVDADCSQVHFSNNVFGRSIDVNVVDGVAIIPDILLQTDKDLNVWAFVGTAENGYTKISKTFKVNRRNKPADYVFTQTDKMTLQTIQRQIGDLADLTTEAKDTLVAAINEAARSGGGGGGSTVELDTTLTQSGKAADAAVVGNRLSALSEEIVTTSEFKVSAHNTGADTHGDIRLLIQGLTDRLNALADSDDTTLDQLSEVVAYIKSNRSLIEAITTSKVSVADIVDNLTTNVTNKPLSAAQGVALKALIDAIRIPEKLPNPNALTFTGAVTGTYDGSAPVEVQIPSGGGGSGGDGNWKLIRTINIVSGTASYSFNTDNNGKAFKIKNFLILIDSYPTKGYLEIKPNGNFSFVQRPTGKQSYPFSFTMKRLIDVRYILETSNTSTSMFERKMSDEYSAFGEFTSFAFWFSVNTSSDTTMYILGEDV